MNQSVIKGLKVLDLSRFLAGPYCSMLLGDHGAEVLKVEPPGSGDPTRTQGPPFFDGDGITFHATNRNKKSLVLDFKDADDLNLVQALAARADILVENFRPGVLKRFGLDYASLSKINPHLIYGSISGFGSSGPMAEQGAFDLTIQALGGYMSITGERGGAPVKLGTSAIDMLAGMNLYSGILMALLARQITGQGQLVETSLLESQVAFLSNAAMEHLLGFGIPDKWGSEHPQLVPYKAFPTADGWVTIGAGVQNLFEKLVKALGKPDLIVDEKCLNLTARLENRAFVNSTIENLTRQLSTNALTALLSTAGVPCSPVLNIEEVFQSEQVQHCNMQVQLQDNTKARQTTIGSAIKYSAGDITNSWYAPPKLNEGGRDLASSWLQAHKTAKETI